MTKLKEAWELYLENADKESLYDAIKKYSIPIPDEYEYPYAHRICDVKIRKVFYRITRVANEEGSIFISRCNATEGNEMQGVPYWLIGEKLQRWIRIASGVETDDRFDPRRPSWEIFLDSPPDQELCESVEIGIFRTRTALDMGASPNAHNGTNTALMLAARWGQKEIVKLLIRKGADPNIVNSGGETALTFAKGHPEVEEILASVADQSKEKSIFDFPLRGNY